MEKYETDYLDSFQRSRPVFTHLDLKNTKFSEEHRHKSRLSFLTFFLFDGLLDFVFSIYIAKLLFCFTCVFTRSLCSVAGDPLKGVLNNSVLNKMEKAMLLLVQKSAAGAVDQERRGNSRANNSVSIEVLMIKVRILSKIRTRRLLMLFVKN